MYVSGGLNPESEKAQDHAIKMYESIRKRRSDYEMISKNTGFSIEQIQIVKNYIFNSRHILPGSRYSKRFHESFEIAESWRRLSEKDGRRIQEHDILLLYHEMYGIDLLLRKSNMTQEKAHIEATKVYNYQYASDMFYKR